MFRSLKSLGVSRGSRCEWFRIGDSVQCPEFSRFSVIWDTAPPPVVMGGLGLRSSVFQIIRVALLRIWMVPRSPPARGQFLMPRTV